MEVGYQITFQSTEHIDLDIFTFAIGLTLSEIFVKNRVTFEFDNTILNKLCYDCVPIKFRFIYIVVSCYCNVCYREILPITKYILVISIVWIY
jgi:hypothetical protein